MTTNTEAQPQSLWAKLGMAGFIFFTVKGLIWLSVPVILAWYVS